MFDKIDSMKIRFSKTGDLKGSSYVKIQLRSFALRNTKSDDKYCFTWSMLAKHYSFENDYPNRVSIYREHFDELNVDGFDFSNGFKCSDVQKSEKLNNSSINILQLSF